MPVRNHDETSARSRVVKWSTLNEDRRCRLECYTEALAHNVTPMRVSCVESADFVVGYELIPVGPLSVLLMSGTGHRVDRGRREIEHSGEHSFHLLLAGDKTEMCLEQRARVRLMPGDAVFVDSSYEHRLTLGEYQVIHLKMPESWVRQWLPMSGTLLGQAIRGHSGWGRALTSFLAQLRPEIVATAALPPSILADQVGALLALAANSLGRSNPPATVAEQALTDRISACILQRSSEPMLTAADIAAVLDISTRTLHRTMAKSGQTFGAALMNARVSVAIRMLKSPIFRRLTIAEIGRRAGFLDASHFVRVVRGRSGRTPGAIRRGAGQTGADRPIF